MVEYIKDQSRPDKIREVLSDSRLKLKSNEILAASKTVAGLKPHVERLSVRLDDIESSLNEIPTIQVAFLPAVEMRAL